MTMLQYDHAAVCLDVANIAAMRELWPDWLPTKRRSYRTAPAQAWLAWHGRSEQGEGHVQRHPVPEAARAPAGAARASCMPY